MWGLELLYKGVLCFVKRKQYTIIFDGYSYHFNMTMQNIKEFLIEFSEMDKKKQN